MGVAASTDSKRKGRGMRVIFSAEIDSGNDAFQESPVGEVQRIISHALKNFPFVDANDSVAVPLRDSNGNKVGELAITLTED